MDKERGEGKSGWGFVFGSSGGFWGRARLRGAKTWTTLGGRLRGVVTWEGLGEGFGLPLALVFRYSGQISATTLCNYGPGSIHTYCLS
jgi:hypothetical protein